MAQVRYRFDSAQTIFQVFEVGLKLPVGLAPRLESDEQGRGIAEIVVGNQTQDTRRQLLFEEVKSVLNLRPDFVAVVDVIVQFHKHIDHAVP